MGFSVKYIDSGLKSLSPNYDIALKGDIAPGEVKAILLVDYFGFLPENRTLFANRAREAGCLVFEDRCHSALTQPSVEVADAVIYSFRKTIPCQDGGAVSLPNQSRLKTRIKPSISASEFLFIVRRTIEHAICKLGLPNLYESRYDSLRDTISINCIDSNDDEYFSPNQKYLECSQSFLLYWQLRNHEYIKLVAARRRDNYLTLQNMISSLELELGFPLLPPDVVPQVLPVVDPSGTLVNFLRANGIGATRWPDYDLPKFVSEHPEFFPNALRFNREMAYLPIHQAINGKHIEKIVGCIRKWKIISCAQYKDNNL